MTSPAQMTLSVRRGTEAPAPKVDLAAYLPRKPLQQLYKNGIVYSPKQPSQSLYLVVAGRIKVSNALRDGEVVCSIVHKWGLFGEAALVSAQHRSDSAIALDPVTLMAWSRTEIEQQIELNPELGLALSRYLAQNCMELAERMKARVIYRTPERVMLAMVQLARQAGVRMADGSTRVESLTHQTVAEYLGTSREVVTFQLNRLRRLGLIHYNRKYIEISTERMEEAIRGSSLNGLSEKKDLTATV
jgi:CRP/FNR family cyclic AMP-dependent transcriptional regulator